MSKQGYYIAHEVEGDAHSMYGGCSICQYEVAIKHIRGGCNLREKILTLLKTSDTWKRCPHRNNELQERVKWTPNAHVAATTVQQKKGQKIKNAIAAAKAQISKKAKSKKESKPSRGKK